MTFGTDFAGGFVRSGSPSAGRPARAAAGHELHRWLGLAMFTGLAALSGATCVLVLHKMQAPYGHRIETGALPAAPVARDVAVALVHGALQRLDDANRSGNYEVFRGLAAPSFQSMNSAADLSRIFAWLRRERIALDVAAGRVEETMRVEMVEARGLLRLTGEVAASPSPVSFDLMLQEAGGAWRLFGIAVFKR